MKRLLAYAILTLSMSGCATTYGPMGYSGGYDDSLLQADMFRIVFKGNGYTSDERVADFALLRAAEVTINNRYNYFAIVDNKESTRVGYAAMPGQARTSGTYNPYSGQYKAQTTYSGGMIVPIEKASSSMIIKCFVSRPGGSDMLFEARALSRNLKKKYTIPVYTKAELEEPPPTNPAKKIFLKDGSIIVGESISLDAGMIKVKTVSGELTIPVGDAVKIE